MGPDSQGSSIVLGSASLKRQPPVWPLDHEGIRGAEVSESASQLQPDLILPEALE